MTIELFDPRPCLENADISTLPAAVFNTSTSFLFLNEQLNPDRKNEIIQRVNQFIDSSNIVTAPSILVPTSGTTSHQLKIVVLKKENVLNAAKKVNAYLKTDANDTWLVSLPLHHIAGLSILARTFLNKNKIFCRTKWDPQTFVDILFQWNINYCSLVPTQVFDILSHNLSAPKNLKAVLVGGSSLTAHHEIAMIKLGWPLLKTFGMTETAAFIGTSREIDTYYDPLPGVEIKLDSNERLSIKTDSLFDGYLAETDIEGWRFQPTQNQNGYWSTDDKAILKGNRFKILGRDYGMIKIKGELINTQLLSQRLVDASSELGQINPPPILHFFPNERDEHELFAIFPKNQSDAKIKNVIRRFNELVLPFERVSWYITVSEIPKTDLGKVKMSSFNTDSFKESYFENRQSIL